MSRLKISSMVLSAVMLLLASCTSSKTEAVLNDVETYIKERPDSALATIRTIDTTSLMTPRLRAHYALLHAMALDKNWIDTTDVNVVMPAVEYYDRHPSGIRRAKAWYYLGRIQQNGGNRSDASISFLKAEKYAEDSEDEAFKGLVYLAISTIYSQTHFHEEALKYAERAYSFFQEAGDSINANSALLCIAKDYNNLKRYSEAESLYRYLIDNDCIRSNLRSDLLCSYALNCVTYKKDFEEAIRYFEESLTSNGSLYNRNSWGAYAYALSRVGKVIRANQIFEQLSVGSDSFQRYVYYAWKSLTDAFEGDLSSAYYLQKEASDIQDENVIEVLKQSSVKAQKDFMEEMNREAEREASRRQLRYGFIMAILIVCFILLILSFKRRGVRIAQEKEAILNAYWELTSQVEEEKAKVRNQYIQMCQSHFGHIGRINEILSVYSKESDNNLYKELKRSIQRIGLDEQSQQRFEELLNDSFDGIMTHFRESFPKKKRRYYQLVSFLFAGFGTTTICTIIPGYNKHNIHVEKSRLKQMIQNSASPYKQQFMEML